MPEDSYKIKPTLVDIRGRTTAAILWKRTTKPTTLPSSLHGLMALLI